MCMGNSFLGRFQKGRTLLHAEDAANAEGADWDNLT